MNIPDIRRLIFSNSTPAVIINLSEVCKNWYQDAHFPPVVQKVICCFDRALGAHSPVLCEPEHCWEELLRRRWIQAWISMKEIFSEPSPRHRSGYIEDAILPKINKGECLVLNKNPKYPNLIGIFTNVSFSLFNRKAQLITKLERPSREDYSFNPNPEQYEHEFDLRAPRLEFFTDQMLVVKRNRNLCCILFDSKKIHKILGSRIIDFTAFKNCLITVDLDYVLRDYKISQKGRIDHEFINLNQAVLQFPEFHGFEIKSVHFIHAKLAKRSCIVAIQLISGNQHILLFLTINCKNNYEIERLGHHSIEDFESISCHVDPTVHRIMVHERDDTHHIKRTHLIDYKKKIHQFYGQPLLQGSFPSYHNSCLAILANFETVQLWTFIQEEDGFNPFLLKTFTVVPHPNPEINSTNLKLFRTGFSIFHNDFFHLGTVHTYLLPPTEKRRCTIQ